jgi:glycine dehydrogenase
MMNLEVNNPENLPSNSGNSQNPVISPDSFSNRHLGPNQGNIQAMLASLGFNSIDDLINATIPTSIRLNNPLKLPQGKTETEALQELREIASQNLVYRSLIGMGYYDCITPKVIQRNILENPGWYTAYTPYQPEIAQGRLEALLNYQTMIMELTGLEIANASLLDEGTAAAEAMTMSYALSKCKSNYFFVSSSCHPQTIEVLKTRANPLGIELIIANHQDFDFKTPIFGALLQYPATDGIIYDYWEFINQVHQQQGLVTVAADLLSLALLTPPGEFGADIAVGNTQRFGVPLGYGGPHAAYFATKDEYKRQVPGRIVGISKDVHGKPALRLALQTREQHIRREKATSNICTSQVLLAVIASMYAVYHGKEGIKRIATNVHNFTVILAEGLKRLGFPVTSEPFFDTIMVDSRGKGANFYLNAAQQKGINLRYLDEETIGISLDEVTTKQEIINLWNIFSWKQGLPFTFEQIADECDFSFPVDLTRQSDYLTDPVFNQYHSETELLRYLHRLESKDLSLTTSMIPLGSCTMKLNATSEMIPITWREFNQIHPFAPSSQTKGYQILCQQLESWLAEITGFSAISLQPNAGSQGEYAGLQVIRKYHQERGESQRNICLIPESAHGTNPASAVMCGMKVVAVKCDERGDINIQDLQSKAQQYKDTLAALMVTYPSTHGVFEEEIKDICTIIHSYGGQVYLDGANMNAQVGLCRPGDFGADVCHLNLHKTFCIPHGGGGPGMGPIGVMSHLVPYLPSTSLSRSPLTPLTKGGTEPPTPLGKGGTEPPLTSLTQGNSYPSISPLTKGGPRGVENEGGPRGVSDNEDKSIGWISAAPYGSASILPISWMYIAMMGGEGLTDATKVAILNANYIAHRLDPYYPVLFKGKSGLVAHECIIDLRPLRKKSEVTVEDVAKRLMDYGFHAPTMSWPVAGTMMIEPTESESKEELDRFCDAMIAIRSEIQAIEDGNVDLTDNLLKNAPHTAESLISSDWNHPYSREEAIFPAPWCKDHKFWVSVGRIDNAFGDRHLVCSCVGMEVYK